MNVKNIIMLGISIFAFLTIGNVFLVDGSVRFSLSEDEIKKYLKLDSSNNSLQRILKKERIRVSEESHDYSIHDITPEIESSYLIETPPRPVIKLNLKYAPKFKTLYYSNSRLFVSRKTIDKIKNEELNRTMRCDEYENNKRVDSDKCRKWVGVRYNTNEWREDIEQKYKIRQISKGDIFVTKTIYIQKRGHKLKRIHYNN